MRMTIIPSEGNQNTAAILTHGDLSIEWHIQRVKKITARADAQSEGDQTLADELCHHINGFWAYMPVEKQAQIFDCYREIYSIMERVYIPGFLIKELRPVVTRLLNHHQLSDALQWLAFFGNYQMPPNIEEQFVTNEPKAINANDQSDQPEYLKQMGAAAKSNEDLAASLKPKFQEKTYIVPEYRELIAMVLVLRTMIPVWGEFIRRTEKETGNHHNTYYAYGLITDSDLSKSSAANKLRIYTERNIRADQITMAAQMVGLGEEIYPEWLFASTLVKRVCVGDISWRQQGSHLVANIFHFISQQYRQADGLSFGMSVREKRFEGPDRNLEHSASRLESYRLMEDIPIGDIAVVEKYLSNYQAVAKQLYANIDLELLELFRSTSHVLNSEPISAPQMEILQWVMAPVVSPRALLRTIKHTVIGVLPIAQTVLWQEGHRDLAILLSATVSNTERLGGNNYHMDSVSQEKLDKIEFHYPYDRVITTKQKTKPINSVMATVGKLAREFDLNPWLLHLPAKIVSQIPAGKVKRNVYYCPPNIRVMLVDLVLWHVERPRPTMPAIAQFNQKEIEQWWANTKNNAS